MVDVTQLLQAAERGDARASGELLQVVYGELRGLARQRLAGERPGHTLQATALVHEAYLRLLGGGTPGTACWDSRGHFFTAAAEAMRRILVEHARARRRLKRGGRARRLPLDELTGLATLTAAESDPDEILALDEALTRLEGQDPDAARVVRLRFFAGLSVEDTAAALGSSPRTVKREWSYARAWLFRQLSEPQDRQDVPAGEGEAPAEPR